MRFVGWAAGLGLGMLLTACLGIESGIAINDNGSGKLVFQYRVSKPFAGLGRNEGGPEKPGLPLPASKRELERILSRAKGVTLAAAEQTETDDDVVVRGEIRFDSVASLNKCGLFDDAPIALAREGGETVFTLRLSDAREPLDEDTLTAFRPLCEGYELAFNITAPRTITSPAPPGGALSADKKTLTYKISLIDCLKISEKTLLRVNW